MEYGFSDIILFHRSRNNRRDKLRSKFWREKMFRKPHLKLLGYIKNLTSYLNGSLQITHNPNGLTRRLQFEGFGEVDEKQRVLISGGPLDQRTIMIIL